MTVADFVRVLEARGLSPRKTGAGWQALCAGHEDHTASLCIAEGKEGRILLRCHAGCSAESIVGALGLKLGDLFPPRANNGDTKPRIVGKYDYQNEAGDMVFQTLRFEPKDFRQRRPNPAKPGEWLWNLNGVPRILYRLPEVIIAVKAGRTIFVVEGEKDVDVLVKNGLVATCNPMGAGKWLAEYAEILSGAARIVVIPDRDEPGRRHAKAVATSLRGLVKSVRVIELPDRNGHSVKDAADWIHGGGTAEELREIVKGAPEFSPDPDPQPFKRGSTAGEYLGEDPVANSQVKQPPREYVAPPLNLLPSVLREFVRATAQSLDVDLAFVFLPLLSALAAAIGNSRNIRIKKGFAQPAILWTTIIARSGSKKSPALTAATAFSCARELELMRLNEAATALFDQRHNDWQKAKPKERGEEPKPPPLLTCFLDDLTLPVIAPILRDNARGALVNKDELASWFGSFGQYSPSKGGASADVSGWLSLFNGERLLLDRKTNRESHRIFHPRLSIAGCIPPSVLSRTLTQDFFQRGLPARILFAAPPPRVNVWTDAEVSAELETATDGIFQRLYELEAKETQHGQVPKELTITPEALEVFIRFYNAVGKQSVEADEQEEAAWNKLTGGAARLALVGHLAHGLDGQPVGGPIMEAATELATWFGHEAERIYACFQEPPEVALTVRLLDFIKRQNGIVTVRKIADNFRPLKNQAEEIEKQLNDLVECGRGEWLPIAVSEKGGHPTRNFHLLEDVPACPCPRNPLVPAENESIADTDTPANPELVEEVLR